MRIHLLSVKPRKSPANSPEAQLIERYLERASRYVPCEARNFATEAALLEFVKAESARTSPFLLLTDSRGKQLSSEELSATVGAQQDAGVQQMMFAIGPADGWSKAALARANLLVAFGRITLPHELSQVIAAEQLYRALAIRAGHPYHTGH